MKRRDLIRKAAVGSLATAGVASAAASAGDVETDDHCHEKCCERCLDHPCGDLCECDQWCNL